MTKNWNQCIEIYKNNEFLEIDEEKYKVSFEDVFVKYNDYTTMLGSEPNKTVWYDLEEKVCFGSEQTFYRNPNDFSFFCKEEEFLTEHNSLWGQQKMSLSFLPVFGEEKFSFSKCLEMFGSPGIDYEKYENKTILVLGAGPSALSNKWQDKVEDCDYVWSCNNYRNFYDLEKKIDLAFIGPTVDIDEEFLSRIKKDKTTIFLEAGVTPYREPEDVKSLKKNLKDQLMWLHFRYFSKLGAAARLLVLANILGAKKVYFVGLDGDPTGQEHAFETSKNIDKKVSNLKYNLFRRQYVLLWEYITERFHKTENINLGEGHVSNLSTGIL
jgi:hypothetical protein